MDGSVCRDSRPIEEQMLKHQVSAHGLSHLGRALVLDNVCCRCGKILADIISHKGHLTASLETGTCPALQRWGGALSGLSRAEDAAFYICKVCGHKCADRTAYAAHTRGHIRQYTQGQIGLRVHMLLDTASKVHQGAQLMY